MLHLALVSNLLTAVGAAPHLRRPAFPQRSRYYPAGITVELRRLDDVTLTRFLALERPEDIDVDLDGCGDADLAEDAPTSAPGRSEEHTSELQSRQYLVC